jgi:hypothetical protein
MAYSHACHSQIMEEYFITEYLNNWMKFFQNKTAVLTGYMNDLRVLQQTDMLIHIICNISLVALLYIVLIMKNT